jgi:hypothetical protein
MSLTLRVLSHEYAGGREESPETAKEEIMIPVSSLLLALLALVFSVVAGWAMIAYPEMFVVQTSVWGGVSPL